jgi:hypothetical protein
LRGAPKKTVMFCHLDSEDCGLVEVFVRGRVEHIEKWVDSSGNFAGIECHADHCINSQSIQAVNFVLPGDAAGDD